MSLIDLAGKKALITGGSRGVGEAAARLFAEAGADVAITYRVRREDAARVGETVKSLSPGATAPIVQMDAADSESVEAAIGRAVEEMGGLDFFVANAGIWPPEEVSVKEMTTDRWSDTIRINLDGVFFGCRAAAGVIADGGSMVLVGSTAGQRGEAMHADYAVSKGALQSFVKSLAVELAPGIRVNCVAPGWIDTEMAAGSYAGEGRQRIESTIPLQRVAAAEDVAGPIVFLCSGLARHITGEVLNINGGSVLCG